MLQAVKLNDWLLRLLLDELKGDKQFLLRTVNPLEGLGLVQFASNELRNIKEFMLQFVKQFGLTLEDLLEELKRDKLVLEAVKESCSPLQFASDELTQDFLHLSQSFSFRGDIISSSPQVTAIETIPTNFSKSVKSTQSPPVTLKPQMPVVTSNPREPSKPRTLSKSEFQKEKKMILKFLTPLGFTQTIGKKLKKDRKFMLEAIKSNAWAFEYAFDELKNDDSFKYQAFFLIENTIQLASKKLKADRKFILKLFKACASEQYKHSSIGDMILLFLIQHASDEGFYVTSGKDKSQHI